MPEQTLTAPETEADALLKEYAGQAPVSQREEVYSSFDVNSEYASARGTLQRVSTAPASQRGANIGEVHAELARIELDLAELNNKYGKLNVTFRNVVGKDRIYRPKDLAGMVWYGMTLRGKRIKEIKVEAARRRGNSIETLVGNMAEVLQDQHTKSAKAVDLLRGMHAETVGQLKTFDKSLVQRLRAGYVGTSKYAQADAELQKLEKELLDVDAVLVKCEDEVKATRAKNKISALRTHSVKWIREEAKKALKKI
jgi:hypothetical protein